MATLMKKFAYRPPGDQGGAATSNPASPTEDPKVSNDDDFWAAASRGSDKAEAKSRVDDDEETALSSEDDEGPLNGGLDEDAAMKAALAASKIVSNRDEEALQKGLAASQEDSQDSVDLTDSPIVRRRPQNKRKVMSSDSDSDEDDDAVAPKKQLAQISSYFGKPKPEPKRSQASGYYQPSSASAPAAGGEDEGSVYDMPGAPGTFQSRADKKVPVGRRSKHTAAARPKPTGSLPSRPVAKAKAAASRSNPIVLGSEEEEVALTSEDDEEAMTSEEDDENDDEGDEDVDEASLAERHAQHLLANCESIGENLRRKLQKVIPESQSSWKDEVVGITQPLNVGSDTLRLKAYQVVGLNWLYLLHQQKLNGILSDEMGLGKTVQCIALLGQLHATGDTRPHLIVAPVSLLANWARELSLWLPDATVVTYHGSQKAREQIRDSFSAGRPNKLVMLAAYGSWQSASSDAKRERKWINKQGWGYVVLDEGHCIKNSKSARHQRLSEVSSKNRLMLTGTPIQNNTQELFAILNFLLPEVFTHEQLEAMDEGGSMGIDASRVKQIIAPFVLRRLKSEVLGQLTPKTEKMVPLTLLPTQTAIYEAVIQRWAQKKVKGGAKAKGKQLEHIFTELRKVANHPLLIRHEFSVTHTPPCTLHYRA